MSDSYFYETGKEERELAERIAELEQQLTEARAEIERLNKMRTHCENCGGDYVATGLEVGCPCLLKAENERLRKPVTVRCSYCGEIICTEAEWNDKVPDHMVSCPKNPARIFALENVRQLAEARAAIERLNKMRTHCENCGGDYVATGLEAFDAVTASRAAGGKG